LVSKNSDLRCPINNWTNHIPVSGIAPFQFQRISCVYGLIARNNLVRQRSCFILRQFVKDCIAKATMDVKENQRAMIEFLLLEGCTSDAILMRLQNVYERGARSGREPGPLRRTSRSRELQAKRWQVRNQPSIEKIHASVPEKNLRHHEKWRNLTLEHRAHPSQRITIRFDQIIRKYVLSTIPPNEGCRVFCTSQEPESMQNRYHFVLSIP
jgi:hypothetical protein